MMNLANLRTFGPFDSTIKTLGPCRIPSPVQGRTFISEEERVSLLTDPGEIADLLREGAPLPAFEAAGPRREIFHDPGSTRAGIVTCGGLCPGLNDVIKGLVHVLHYDYGIHDVLGFRYGYQGLNPANGHEPMQLTADVVDHIHEVGGTILGSSRGEQSIPVMVDYLQSLDIRLMFCIGGDGTLRGASAIEDEVTRRGLPISVVGLPKTIDNDLLFLDRSFGFETAVYATFDIITQAHVEARGAFNGISVVKLMGRDSGFIAAAATLANSVVDFCLIPEVPVRLSGHHGLLMALERRLQENAHAVVVVAEGAGQDLFKNEPMARDASGNIRKHDIGELLVEAIRAHFKEIGVQASVRYFDPSYSIRSGPAKGTDAMYCHSLADHAVHAAMAGKTDLIVGRWLTAYTHVPIDLATRRRNKVDPRHPTWKAILSLTRQEKYFQQSQLSGLRGLNPANLE